MRLYLVQHGEAVPEEKDPARPLSEKGRADAARTARLLARAGAKLREVRHSGKRRALETAEELGRALGAPLVEAKGLAPNDPVAPVAAELAGAAGDLALVGHLPHLAKLAALLLAGRESPPVVDMHMGGVVCLERDDRGAWRVAYAVPAWAGEP